MSFSFGEHPIICMLQNNDITCPEDLDEEVSKKLDEFPQKVFSITDLETIYTSLSDIKQAQKEGTSFGFSNINYKVALDLIKLESLSPMHLNYIAFILLKSCCQYIFLASEYQTSKSLFDTLKILLYCSSTNFRVHSINLFMLYFNTFIFLIESLNNSDHQNILSTFIEKYMFEIRNIQACEFTQNVIKLIQKDTNSNLDFAKCLIKNAIKSASHITKETRVLNSIPTLFPEIISCEDIEVYQLIVQFFDVASGIHRLSTSDIDSLYVALTKSNYPNSIELIKKLIIGTPGSKYIINPKAIFLLIEIQKYIDGFIFDLLTSDVQNIILCHNNELDLQLIKYVKKCMEDLESNTVVIGQTLQLFEEITVIISSSKVVNEFLSLLEPDQEGKVSKLYTTFIGLLSDILQRCSKAPIGYMVNNCGSQIEVKNQTTTNIGHTFTFSSWIQLPPNHDQSRLFEIKSTRGSYKIMIDEQTLKVSADSGKAVQEATFGFHIPTRQWVNIAVGFSRDLITFYVDGVRSESLQIKSFDLEKGELSILIGGSGNSALLIGSFALFNSVSDAISKQAFETGPRMKHNNEYVIFQAITTSINGGLSLDTTDKIILQGSTNAPLRFLDVLVRTQRVSSLSNLFKTLDSEFVGNEIVPPHASILFDIVGFAISASSEAESDFLADGGYQTIGEIFAASDRRNITYHSYQKLYLSYETSKSKQLAHEILQNMVLSFSIWMRSEPGTFDRITRHWARTVYVDHREEALSVHNFVDLIVALRVYFWTEPVETEIVDFEPGCGHERPKDFEVEKVRQGIEQVLHYLSTVDFNVTDFSMMIGSIVTCTDYGQVAGLLELMKLIAVSEETPFAKVEEQWGLFSSLHHLMNCEDENITFGALEIFCALHLLHYMKTPKVHHHVSMLMDMVPIKQYSHQFFGKLVPLVNKFQEFMPLAFYAVIHSGEKTGLVAIDYLKPAQEFARKKSWALWPCIAALKIGGEMLSRTMNFLARCTFEHWTETFAVIDIVAKTLGVDEEKPKSEYIHGVTKYLLEQKLQTYDYIHHFFDIAMFHVLFRPESGETPAFISKMLSELGMMKAPKQKNSSNSSVFSKDTFFAKMSELTKAKPSYKFGLRMDADGHWLDAKLGIDLCKQALRTKNQTLHNFSAMMAAFATNEESTLSEAQEIIDQIIKAKVAEESFIKLIKRHDRRDQVFANTDCFEKHILGMIPHNEEIINMSSAMAAKCIREFEKSREAMMEQYSNNDSDLLSKTTREVSRISALFHAEFSKDNSSIKVGYCGIPTKVAFECQEPEYNPPYNELLEDARKTALAKIPPPSDMKINELKDDEIVLLELNGHRIRGAARSLCQLRILSRRIDIFLSKRNVVRINVKDIDRIEPKLVFQLQTGFEITTTKGLCYLIDLEQFNSITLCRALKNLPAFQNINIELLTGHERLRASGAEIAWKEGRISNMEYLMVLNNCSGRSFCDFNNYPIFPFIFEGRSITKPISENLCSPSSKASLIDILQNQSENSIDEMFEKCKKFGAEAPPEIVIHSDLFDNLETPEVTLQLPRWIDRVFGVFQPDLESTITSNAWKDDGELSAERHAANIRSMLDRGCLPLRLFNDPHHPKSADKRKATIKTARITESNIISAAISDSVIFVLCENKVLKAFKYEIKDDIVVFDPSGEALADGNRLIPVGDDSCAFIGGSGILHIAGGLKAKVRVDADKLSAIAADSNIVCVGSSNGIVGVWDDGELHSVATGGGTVAAVAVSKAAGIAVASAGNVLVEIDLQTGSRVMEERNDVVTHLAILPISGRIVAASVSRGQHRIGVISHNSCTDIGGSIRFMCAGASGGREFVAVCTDSGEVSVFDVAALIGNAEIEPIASASMSDLVVGMASLWSSCCVAVLTRGGALTLLGIPSP